jgi:hypothetical protein
MGKQWITGSSDVCPICGSVAGKVVPWTEEFHPTGGDSVPYPPVRRRVSVIVLSKTTALIESTENALPMIGSETMVLGLQNGLGNAETLSRAVPEEQILYGLCEVGSDLAAALTTRRESHPLGYCSAATRS